MTNDSATPLPPDIVDELLSADLDGELDAAALDLGLDAATARARLASTPGIDARRAALTRARDLIGDRPALDDATTARLVAAALPHAPVDALTSRRNARRGRVLVVVGVAAAIAVVLLAVGVMRQTDDTEQFATSGQVADTNATASTDTAAGGSAFTPDLGEVSDPDVLRERVASATAEQAQVEGDQSAASESYTQSPSALDSKKLADGVESTLPAAGDAPPRAVDAPASERLSADCLAAQARAFDITAAPSLTAAATFDGAPASVIVYTVPEGHQVLVVSPDGCTLLLAQLLR